MKVLHLLAYAERGGCEKNAYYFIESTPEFSHDVIVMGTSGPMVGLWIALGAEVTVLPLLHLNLFSFRNKLHASLPKGQYDKIIVWTSVRMPLVVSSLNRYYPAIIFVHFGNPVTRSMITHWKNKFLSILFPVRNNVHLRPVSQFVASYLKNDGYFKQFPIKVSMKPIQTSVFRSKKPSTVNPSSAIHIGMVARLDPIKDHHTVIHAYAKVLAEFPYMHLHIVGDGILRKNLEKLCADLRLSHVQFHGEQQNVNEIMKNWDLFVYGTTLKEGLGGTIPEALSIGLPVVAMDLPMIREWDKDGAFLSYCSPSDASDMAAKIKQLLYDVEHRKKVYEYAPVYIHNHFSPRSFSLNYIRS